MTHRFRCLTLGTLLALALPLLAPGQPPAGKGGPRTDPHGDPLPDGALARMGTARWRLEEGTQVVGFTPDGKGLVVNPNRQQPGPLHVLEVPSGKEWLRLHGVDYRHNYFSLATCGPLLAVGVSGRLALWEMPAGRLLRQISIKDHHHILVALAPDGKTVATGGGYYEEGKTNPVQLWDVATGRLLVSLDGHRTAIHALAFSADGKRLLSSSGEYRIERKSVLQIIPGAVRVWDVTTRKPLTDYPNDNHSVLFAPDGRAWAYQGRDNRIHLIEADGGKEVARIGVQASAFTFAPDGKALATANYGQPILLWDAATGKELRRLEGQVGGGYPTLFFAPDGKTLACSTQVGWASTGGTIRFWDVATGKEIRTYPGHPDEVACVAQAPDGKTVASGSNDGSLFLWEAATGKALHRLADHPGGVSAVAFAPDNRLLASGGKDGLVRLWRVADGKEVRPLEWPAGAVLALAFAADGKSIWACGAKGKLQGWDVTGGAGPGAFDLGLPSLSRATFSADGSLLACVGGEVGEFGGGSHVQVYRVSTGKKLLTLELEGRNPARGERGFEALHCWAVAFSGDGRLLATSESIQTQGLRLILGNHTIRVWELATGKQVLQVADLAVATRHMAFSPDGRLLAHGHGRGTGWGQGVEEVFFLRDLSAGVTLHQQRKDEGAVICLHSGAALRPLRGHVGRASCVAFAPDGKALLTGGGDGTLTAWAAAPFLPGPERRPADVSAKELQALWDQLASGDSTLGYQAIGRLELARGQTIPLLKERLKPEPAADPKRVAELITDLESKTFAVRQKAFNELARYAEQAEDALRRALPEQRSLEAQRRVQQLLDRLDKMGLSPERLRVLRALTLLERIGTAEARGVLEALAAGAPTRLTREARATLRRLEQRTTPMP